MEGFHFSWDEWDKIFIDNCLEFDPEIEVVGTPFVFFFLFFLSLFLLLLKPLPLLLQDYPF